MLLRYTTGLVRARRFAGCIKGAYPITVAGPRAKPGVRVGGNILADCRNTAKRGKAGDLAQNPKAAFVRGIYPVQAELRSRSNSGRDQNEKQHQASHPYLPHGLLLLDPSLRNRALRICSCLHMQDSERRLTSPADVKARVTEMKSQHATLATILAELRRTRRLLQSWR